MWGELRNNTESDTQLLPLKLNISEKFTEIASHNNFHLSAALSTNGLYYIWEKLVNMRLHC